MWSYMKKSDSAVHSHATSTHPLTSHMVITPVHAFLKEGSVRIQTMV